tara:strand:+ start:33 stop:227 length:195 start_codon:yes stop_codon:yes gene_type:complete
LQIKAPAAQGNTARAAQTTGRNALEELIALETKITYDGGTPKKVKIPAQTLPRSFILNGLTNGG